MKHIFYLIFIVGLALSPAMQAQSLRVYLKSKAIEVTEIMPGDVALSEQAISKRKMRGIALDFRDVPVNRAHMDQITSLGGTITARSRWFNYVVVKGVSRELLEAQPFVHKIEVPKTYEVNFAMTEAGEQTHTLNYGLAQGQIEMLRGQKLHEMGYQGQGMTIAVLDGGFIGTNNGAVFDSLWMNNRILGTYNFVDGDTNVFTDGSHGTKVLSILGGYLDNQIIGSAPKANYWLLKSEKESSETPVEMDYWLMAAEFADSVGADIISSSLGYNEFQSGFDYQYSDMDGNTTVVTKAADMAAQKGILVVVSAGNEGSGSWKYITAPADGDSVLAIGGVNSSGDRVSFSSIGPSADGRIKPDVMAQGGSTAYATGGSALTGNGTSFSCPIVAGMAACLWQSNITKSNMEIYNEIRLSGSRSFNPDNEYGYGIPNFEHAFYQVISLDEMLSDLKVDVFPNPVKDLLNIRISDLQGEWDMTLVVRDIAGNELLSLTSELQNPEFSVDFPFAKGIYIVNLTIGDHTLVKKILK